MINTKNDAPLYNEEDDEGNEKVFRAFKTSSSASYDIFLSKNVESDITNYWNLIRLLDEAGEQDVVNLRLSNYGGDLHTGVALAHAVKNCRATTLVHVTSNCYSMGAILALCGDGLLIYPGNYLMFHNYSGGEIGKAGEIETSHKANKKCWTDYLNYFCSPFLTEKEIATIMSDKDVYVHFDSKGLKGRMKRQFPNMIG